MSVFTVLNLFQVQQSIPGTATGTVVLHSQSSFFFSLSRFIEPTVLLRRYFTRETRISVAKVVRILSIYRGVLLSSVTIIVRALLCPEERSLSCEGDSRLAGQDINRLLRVHVTSLSPEPV